MAKTLYSNYNDNKRKMVSNIFEKDLCKLVNSNAYGKTMKNVGNRVSVRLAANENTCHI